MTESAQTQGECEWLTAALRATLNTGTARIRRTVHLGGPSGPPTATEDMIGTADFGSGRAALWYHDGEGHTDGTRPGIVADGACLYLGPDWQGKYGYMWPVDPAEPQSVAHPLWLFDGHHDDYSGCECLGEAQHKGDVVVRYRVTVCVSDAGQSASAGQSSPRATNEDQTDCVTAEVWVDERSASGW